MKNSIFPNFDLIMSYLVLLQDGTSPRVPPAFRFSYFEGRETKTGLLSSENERKWTFNLFTLCVGWSAMLCKRPQGVFPMLVGRSCCVQSSVHWATREPKTLSAHLKSLWLRSTKSKPLIKHPASSLSLFKQKRDVAVWLRLFEHSPECREN